MNVFETAKLALECGIPPIPVRPDGTKRPLIPWAKYQRQLPTPNQVTHWFGPSQQGVGIITGRVSGGLEMLEFEGRAVESGAYNFFLDLLHVENLTDLWDQILAGYSERTPSGGIHVLYRCPDTIEGNLRLAAGAAGVLAETRGEGGFTVIAPTSGTCHLTGKPWEIMAGGLDTITTITSDQRKRLHETVAQLAPQPQQSAPESRTPTEGESLRPGDQYNQTVTVDQTLKILVDHGWQVGRKDPDGTIHLTRPGKTSKDGESATLGSPKTGGGFYPFTTSTDFEAGRAYTPWQVYAYLEHDKDFRAAAQALVASEPSWTVTIPTHPPEDQVTNGIQYLDLDEVATGLFADEQWLIEPLIPHGRQTSVYAQGKTGKSLLLLECALAAATGRPILYRPPSPPIHVLYVDFEMTPADLQERLDDMGYTPSSPDWNILRDHLHYAQLQPFYPFDTVEGGNQLLDEIAATRSELVIIDTLIRSVKGEENSSDTIKDFNRYTGQRLKAAGISLVRIDHAGKDSDRGQRGTSAKRDDVDLIWQLRPEATVGGKNQVTCLNRASRMPWVPTEIAITRTDDPLHHTIPAQQLTAPQQAAADWLDQIGHPVDLALNRSWDLLRVQAKIAGHSKRCVQSAQTYRRTHKKEGKEA